MSDARAIAAVTSTLRSLLETGVHLDPDLVDAQVTMLPLDRARDNTASANQLNLFLYQTMPAAAWRNQDMPRQAKPGETAPPPLALNLYYLVTAFGKDNDATSPFSHQLLGRAMSVLHDHPLLGSAEIRSAFPKSDTSLQIERIRLTLQPLPVEDIFKLWSGFQTQYRLSAAYEVSVVLIDSTRSARTPLPVLARGANDTGVQARGDLVPPYPTIEPLALPKGRPNALLGDVLTVSGHHLAGGAVKVLFRHRLLPDPIVIDPINVTDTQVSVKLPDTAAAAKTWLAGIYGVALEIAAASPDGTQTRTTNEVGLSLAPRVVDKLPLTVKRQGTTATIKLQCGPQVLPEQRVSLLLGDLEVMAEARTVRTGAVTFKVTNAVAGDYRIRLRVEGIDSLIVDPSPANGGPPVFFDAMVSIE
ncbi:MAG: DUF4255 domain-containing protein [Leptothrix sp. (in: b-proteobacteria)]